VQPCAQTPATHVSGDVQVMPQLPQLELSVCSLTHAAPQAL
jgi:hypothetical protein